MRTLLGLKHNQIMFFEHHYYMICDFFIVVDHKFFAVFQQCNRAFGCGSRNIFTTVACVKTVGYGIRPYVKMPFLGSYPTAVQTLLV